MSGDMNVLKQVLDVLPCDPFEQIDIARKITSIALSTRVSSLESESSILQQHIAARDDVIVDLESKLHSFDFSLSQDLHNLSLADHQKREAWRDDIIKPHDRPGSRGGRAGQPPKASQKWGASYSSDEEDYF
nr:hypothetical protein CTI12_AA501740 [Tanacetum cinerariifolium]